MFLKKIVVHGFKSFADKTEIIVEKGMTAIVGPNGSGKSNISDSIKWVLGEQSPKTLRGSKMEDIIFAGTEKRMPLGYADVELIFDNTSKMLPIEHDEVGIKRRLFRTGESEYYINKKPCRLKDIKELFMDTGIGRDGYSVIGQGKVEEILSPNSEVRRAVFEEAAGIVKYKTRKEESIKKLEKTNDNLDRVNDIIHELEIRVAPLKKESENAKEYLRLKDELKNLELNLFVREYEKNKQQASIYEAQKNEVLIQKNKLSAKRDNLEKTVQEQKSNIDNLNQKSEKLISIKNELNKDFQEKLNAINIFKEKVALYSENKDAIENEIKLFLDKEKGLSSKIDEYLEEIKERNSSKDRIKSEFDELNERAIQFKIDMEASENSTEEKKNALFEMHKNINKLQSDINSIISIRDNFKERIDYFDKEIEIETKGNSEKKLELENIKFKKIDTEKMLFEHNKNYEKIQTKHDNFLEDKKEAEKRLSDAYNNVNNAAARINFLTNMENLYEGYYKSVQILMGHYKKDNLFKGSINGTVADIIKTDKKFETAIEIALGSAIQNVIVNNEQDAEAIIKYLKDNKIGRVTFLPINTIKKRILSNDELKILSYPGVIDTADKLIETDELYEDIIKNLLGRTVIVETINDGFRVSKALGNTLKIVSLEGDVINPGGAVTGGHISTKNQSFLTRKREIEENKANLDNFKKKYNNIKEDIKDIEIDIIECNKDLKSLKYIIDQANQDIMQLSNNISLISEQIQKSDNLINKYISDKEYIIDENAKRDIEIEEKKESIKLFHDNINNLESEINNISEATKENKDIYEKLNEEISQKNNEIMILERDIKFACDRIENLKTEIANNKEMIKLKRNALNDSGNEIEFSKKQIIVLENENKLLSEKIEKNDDEYTHNKELLSKEQESIDNNQSEFNGISKKITELLDDEYLITGKTDRVQAKIESILAKLWEDYEMNYAMALPYKDESISYSKIENDVLAIRRDIKKLGDINVNAIKEYDEVKTRYEFLTKQKNDLVMAGKQLESVISELEIKMKNQFSDEFAKIRVMFNNVFKDLFNGGKADVYLEDENDALNSAIEIKAQPPGKNLSKISLLSGGEKALTAIALLFAILKTKPTSFCILDEIEAALDDVNVYRFSRYLKEFSKETQFLCITHRKGTMENADTLYGTTMEENGVTKLVSMRLSDIA